MKKIAIIFVLIISFTSVAQTNLKNDTWYIGSKIGSHQHHDTNFYKNNINNITNVYPVKNTHLGGNVFMGYQVNPVFGLELEYDWMGRIKYKDNTSNLSFLKTKGLLISTKLSQPLRDNLDIYGKLGTMLWKIKYDNTHNKKNNNNIKYQDTGVSPLISLGLEYFWNKKLATSLEYEWINNIGNADTIGTRFDNSQLNIGLSYYFYKKDKNTQDIRLINQDNNFILKYKVLFDFDKYTLKAEDKKILNQIFYQFKPIDLKNTSITIMGYTDRIGTEEYNKNLSLKRAQYVMNYVISKVIPFDKIFLYSMGRVNSITDNTCDKIKNSNNLIKCLKLDRKVEIEIKGIKMHSFN